MAPLYFWREYEATYGFLSQWYADDFAAKGNTYKHAEMWMMWSKAMLFGDKDAAEEILKTKDPRKCQQLGRKVKGYDGRRWDQKKLEIVTQGNIYKFTCSVNTPKMKQWLLETGDQELVEASPYDKIWGVGFAAADATAKRSEWGQNLLGKALMEARRQIREQEKSKSQSQGESGSAATAG